MRTMIHPQVMTTTHLRDGVWWLCETDPAETCCGFYKACDRTNFVNTVGYDDPFYFKVCDYGNKGKEFTPIAEAWSVGKLVNQGGNIALLTMGALKRFEGARPRSPKGKCVLQTFRPNQSLLQDDVILLSNCTINLEEGQFIAKLDGEVVAGGRDLLEHVISDKGLRLTPGNRPRKARAGTIIYNKNSKKFEGYDGKVWHDLQWGDQ